MSNTHSSGPAAGHDEHSFDRKAIWRTFWVLLIITVIELTLAIIHYETEFPPKYVLNGVYAILTLAKAFFIIAEFMHLRHEIKNMIMTVGVPALLFVWFVTAFLWDGNSYKNLRNTYDRHHKEQNLEKMKTPEGHKEGEKDAEKEGHIH